MDEVERAFRELQFEIACLTKTGDEYQDWFATIMEKRYPGDFQRVRAWGTDGDEKNDGYLVSERRIFQVYAPNAMKAAITRRKIDEDYTGAVKCWDVDRWTFTHNAVDGLSPPVLKKLLEVRNRGTVEVDHLGPQELRTLVFELSSDQLFSLFGPAPTREELVNLGMESLAPVLDQISRLEPTEEPDLRPPPADKIKRNMLSRSVDDLLRFGMSKADLVRRYFKTRPEQRDENAEIFKQEYERLREEGHSPDAIFGKLQKFASGNEWEPNNQCAVLAVLAYFFEECDIFERDDTGGGVS